MNVIEFYLGLIHDLCVNRTNFFLECFINLICHLFINIDNIDVETFKDEVNDEIMKYTILVFVAYIVMCKLSNLDCNLKDFYEEYSITENEIFIIVDVEIYVLKNYKETFLSIS